MWKKFIYVTSIFMLVFITGCGKNESNPVAGKISSYSDTDNSLKSKVSLLSNGVITWEKTYGGADEDVATSVQQTTDGGYIVGGYTISLGAGGYDFYVIKVDANGNTLWEKTFGGSDDDLASSIQQTSDGGYIVAGYTRSFGAGADAYVIKLDASGNKEWEKTYGSNGDETAESIQQTTDGGYIVAGTMNNYSVGVLDFYVIKLDSDGNIIWEKNYDKGGNEVAMSIRQTSDGGYIIAGWTEDSGNTDFYVLKLDANGNKEWEKTYGGSDYEIAQSIQQTTDGGYIVAGATGSLDTGYFDFYIIKLDSNGNKIWEKTYGGVYWDMAFSIQQTTDSGYIVSGGKDSTGEGFSDFYIIKLDADGNKIWEKIYGESDSESAYSIQQTSDGGYIVAGGKALPGSEGNTDVYVIKTDENGNVGGGGQSAISEQIVSLQELSSIISSFFGSSIEKGLTAKVDSAIASLNRAIDELNVATTTTNRAITTAANTNRNKQAVNQINTAKNELNSLINLISAQSGKKIPKERTQEWINIVRNVISKLDAVISAIQPKA